MRIITVGDSITRGTRGVRPDVKPEETFAALIQKALIEKGFATEVTNAGIGGDTVDALRRLQAGVIASKPHIVTLMYGTNDSYVAKGQMAGRNSITDYEAAMRKMIRTLKEADIHPVLMTSPPWAEGANPDGLNQNPNVQLTPYVEICRTVASDLQVSLVDHFAHWSEASKTGFKLREWTSEFCHPNPSGHQELAALMLQTLLPLAEKIAPR